MFRVFISSVQKELEVERVSIASAVSSDQTLSQFCQIVLYDREPLSGRRLAKPYLKCLDSCQIYILLIDREYSGATTQTMSATHEEYRHAMTLDIPMVIFVRGHHDTARKKETQSFFKEIKTDGHEYRRFHDRVDLLPEVKGALVRILDESFDIKIKSTAVKHDDGVGKASLFEQQVLDVRDTELDLDVAQQWLRKINALGEKESPARPVLLNMLREKGLVRREQRGSVYKAMASGLLFLGKNPAARFPQCRILADAYYGTEPDPNPKDQETLSAPAPIVVEQAAEFIMRNIRHPIRVIGMRRIKLDEYPLEAIREAIVNAIAHRDYEDAARPIYVKIFFDRIEILSPGSLLRPLTIGNLLKGNYEPCSRNPVLAQYLGHLHLMEQRGSGIRRMHSAMIDHGLALPNYELRNGYFTVILKGPADNMASIKIPSIKEATSSIEERLTQHQRDILKWLAAGESVTNRKCQKRFRISKVTATKYLKALVEYGLAERIGKGRSARYVYSGTNR
jgi:ATP-dependent DNA helicase RecG